MNKDLTSLKGIGPKKAKALSKLDIYTVRDLYTYYPREYEDRRIKASVLKASPTRSYYFEWKAISKAYVKRLKNMIVSYMYFAEGDFKKIRVIWFNDRFSIRKIRLNETYKFYTKVAYKNGYYESVNPIFENLDGDMIGAIYSMYPLTSGISQKNLNAFIKEALKEFDVREDILSKSLKERFNLMDREKALKEVHFPSNLQTLFKAKTDIKIGDLLKELIFLDYLGKLQRNKQDISLKYDLKEILAKLSFSLTRSQLRSLKEILEDSDKDISMNRLLIGDVGSGKTIVAMVSMLVFGLNSYQAAMMVPTEVLAIQQYEKYKDFIGGFGLKLALLTGSSKNKEEIKEGLRDGTIDMVVGTHALIEEDVKFRNLRLVVNDEQHRFGVRQRQELAKKGIDANYLTMTATPIPRTLSLRINKMLDLSIINELPKGRASVITSIVNEDHQEFLFENIKEGLKAGRQVYVVSNNIDAEDTNSVENLYKKYKKIFKTHRVEKLHGKLKASLKEEILKKFNNHEIDILISTTVIEVGIDVANANTMVIYNSNNFGLSQLHQLRGRVGRGEYDSYCYLVSKDVNPKSKLKILVDSNDGFEISQKDYELRGGGKILSLIQHGKNLSEIEFLNMTEEETNKTFEIFDYLKENSYKGVNLEFIRDYFDEDKDIILN
ncbi:putative ATP-dependent DNA helicase RecG [Anaerococcus lactolyticus ATCC 51172]|uniref:Putative ATP-dependent DNA helicase RecG n=1 Tax=Anaerococcus lactolyticus ATCC 51172 TaxID=525254 RepID=C2BDQ4_9FIRM|nr:putative ATP-dependent DNA helicase RecG [Anaerococcus lactolyticus ATCC 51172]